MVLYSLQVFLSIPGTHAGIIISMTTDMNILYIRIYI